MHLTAVASPGEGEEAVVERGRDATAVQRRIDADEVDVGDVGPVLGEEADEERGELATGALGDMAGAGEVLEVQPRQQQGPLP